MQGGTYKEMPHSVVLVMDGAAGLLAKGGMGFGVVEVEVMEAKVFELVLGEAQFPRNVGPAERKGIVVLWNEGHGEVAK